MTSFPGTDLPPETLRAAAAGERQAFDAIYGHYRKPVYTLVRRLISRPAVADDLLQDVFVEILRSVGSYSGQGSFGGWVRAIAVSKCLMYLRSPWASQSFVAGCRNARIAECGIAAFCGAAA